MKDQTAQMEQVTQGLMQTCDEVNATCCKSVDALVEATSAASKGCEEFSRNFGELEVTLAGQMAKPEDRSKAAASVAKARNWSSSARHSRLAVAGAPPQPRRRASASSGMVPSQVQSKIFL